jgi:hypothetical protein
LQVSDAVPEIVSPNRFCPVAVTVIGTAAALMQVATP